MTLSPQDMDEQSDEAGQESSLLTSALTFRTYSYRENLLAEFERLVKEGRRFDALIVDLMQIGFSLPLDTLVKFHAYGKRLLKPRGVLLCIKPDGAIALSKDDPGGGLIMNVYDSPFGIFARYPMLADYVCATVSGIDRRRLRGGGNTLANHILYTSTPVLRRNGEQLKTTFELPPPQNWLLQTIDDYASIEAIATLMETRHNVHFDESLRLLQELESEGAIFPIFSRIQFLANCYHNRKPFRLGRYMVTAGIITPSQLEELLELQQEEGWGKSSRAFLGVLAIRRGYINTRELEVLLHDQFIYGGYHKVNEEGGDSSVGIKNKRTVETMRDSMIGSLGAIDGAGLLQSISTAKKTGLLTIENRDKSLVVAFTTGKPTHARLDKLLGVSAMVEFLVTWTEGIFVFRDKGTTRELDDTCTLSYSLEKMLLEAAYAQDISNKILSALPGGRSAILERAWNFDQLWADIQSAQLKYLDDLPVSDADKPGILAIAKLVDGLTIVDDVLKQNDNWPSHMVLRAVQFLLDKQMISIQQTSLFRPLTIFQRITAEIQEHIGKADNKALLEASLHYVHGDSSASQRFDIDHEGRVSVNLSQVKTSGTAVSLVLLEMRRWMEAYLAYARRQTSSQLVDNVVAKVVHGTIQ